MTRRGRAQRSFSIATRRTRWRSLELGLRHGIREACCHAALSVEGGCWPGTATDVSAFRTRSGVSDRMRTRSSDYLHTAPGHATLSVSQPERRDAYGHVPCCTNSDMPHLSRSNWPLVIAVAVVALSVVPLYIDHFSAPPLSYYGMPFPADGPVSAGQVIRLHVGRCNTASEPLTYTATRTLVRTDVQPNEYIAMPYTGSTAAPGCSIVVSALNEIPEATPPGMYEIQAVSLVPWSGHVFELHWRSASFQVIG